MHVVTVHSAAKDNGMRRGDAVVAVPLGLQERSLPMRLHSPAKIPFGTCCTVRDASLAGSTSERSFPFDTVNGDDDKPARMTN